MEPPAVRFVRPQTAAARFRAPGQYATRRLDEAPSSRRTVRAGVVSPSANLEAAEYLADARRKRAAGWFGGLYSLGAVERSRSFPSVAGAGYPANHAARKGGLVFLPLIEPRGNWINIQLAVGTSLCLDFGAQSAHRNPGQITQLQRLRERDPAAAPVLHGLDRYAETCCDAGNAAGLVDRAVQRAPLIL